MTPRESDRRTGRMIERHVWFAFIALLLVIAVLSIAGCAGGQMVAPEPRVVTVDVPRIVQQKCADARPPVDTYPDADAALAQIPDGDFEALAKAFRAGRALRDARLLLDDVQIRACAGE